ncbi:DnaJ family domain-containing protein [Micromonospora sp. NPDC050276]|uniref:DnaJ family domain-containing protein n=1 Tax=Micromonospora sp. NPDC050276 TaxID=3364278 RepID=UPI00378BF89B
MTEAWEASVEAKIQDAVQRGEFDDLPGMGKPIPGRGAPYDEAWWIKSFLEREALPSDLLLPTSLQLRRRVEQVPDEVRDLPTEQAVRDFVGQLNTQIVAWLRFPDDGPRVAVRPVNTEDVVRRWRAEHTPPRLATPTTDRVAATAGRRSRRTWWLPWRRRPR